MKITDKQYKLIEKYLDKTLTTEQTSEFQDALKIDSFREQLLFQARLVDSSKEVNRENLREQLNKIAPIKKKQSINKRNLFLLLGVIAIYLSFLLANKMLQPDSTGSELYAQYFVELPPDVSKRGTQNEFAIEYQQAMQHYIDKDYRTALLAFENLAGSSDDIDLYKAMCQLHLEENKMAKMSLMALLKSKEKRIRQNANWYLILLSVRESDFIKAKESLSYIVENEGHLFLKQAIKLKADLE